MKIAPLYDQVHLKRIEPAKQVGSIIVPDTAQEKDLKAKVLAVGPGRITDNGVRILPTVKVGDTVLLPYMRGADLLETKGKFELVLKESELLGVVEGE